MIGYVHALGMCMQNPTRTPRTLAIHGCNRHGFRVGWYAISPQESVPLPPQCIQAVVLAVCLSSSSACGALAMCGSRHGGYVRGGRCTLATGFAAGLQKTPCFVCIALQRRWRIQSALVNVRVQLTTQPCIIVPMVPRNRGHMHLQLGMNGW